MALIVFLKGINVGGHRRFRPSTLAARLRRLGAVNVGTAGTFVIRKPVRKKELRAAIRRLVPFEAEIVICEGREIVELASRQPFREIPSRRDLVQFVSVQATRRARPLPPLELPATGRWGLKVLAHRGRFILGVHRREMRAIGHLAQLEKLAGGPITTRSWSTIEALARLIGV